MSVGLPLVSARKSNFLPLVSVRTKSGLANGRSSSVAAWVFAEAETSATGLLEPLSPLLPQAVRVSAAAAARAAAVSAVLVRMR